MSKSLLARRLLGGAALTYALVLSPPSYANSSPQEGFVAAVNAGCRYKKMYPGVSNDRVIAYIFSGIPPSKSFLDNFAKANRVDVITAGSLMMGLVDWIQQVDDAKKIYKTFESNLIRKCG